MERLFRLGCILLLSWLMIHIGFVFPSVTEAKGTQASFAQLRTHVKDDAGLFTDQDIERMNRALANHHYKLYVMTASGYTEQDGMKLADQLYDEFGLRSNELLLLVTTNPNFVHIAFENDDLAAQIAASRAASVRGVTDTQFVPHAKNGDVAGGVIAVSEYINGLQPASDPGGYSTDEGNPLPLTPDTEQMTKQQSQNLHLKRQLVIQIGIAVLIAALLTLAVLLQRRLSTRRTLLRRRTVIQRQIGKIEHRIGILLGSDALNTDISNHGSRDKTMLQSQLRQDAEQHLQYIQQCRSVVRSIRLPLMSLSRSRLELSRLEHELMLVEEQLVPLEQQHALLHGTVPLDVLSTANAPSTADDEAMETAHESADTEAIFVSDATHDLEQLAAELQAFVTREGLYIGGEENPLALIEMARNDQQRMRKLQARGDQIGATAARRTLERHVQQAQRLVQDMLRFREQAMQVSEEAKRLLEEYELLPDWYAREWAKLEGHYANAHLHEQQERYEEMKHWLQRIDRLCPQMVHNLLGGTPHYARAYEDSLQISAAMERLQEQRLALLSYPEELDLRKKLDMERWEALSSHHRDIASRINETQPDHLQIGPFQEQSFQSLERARLLLLEEPIDLDTAEQALERTEQHLEMLIRQFEGIELTSLPDHLDDNSPETLADGQREAQDKKDRKKDSNVDDDTE